MNFPAFSSKPINEPAMHAVLPGRVAPCGASGRGRE